MGIAAENSGIAPTADIIFTQIHYTDSKDLSESAGLLQAVNYVFSKAGSRPCVVNVSLGTFLGPHDGSSSVEQAFDAILANRQNSAIVIAAGNSYQKCIHQKGAVALGCSAEIVWVLPFSADCRSMQIWYSEGDEFELSIVRTLRNGNTSRAVIFPFVSSGKSYPYKDDGTVLGQICNFRQEKDRGSLDRKQVDHLITIDKFANNDREWKLTIKGIKITSGGVFHAWTQRESSQATFRNSSPECTLGSISTGYKTICVGAYDGLAEGFPSADFSSAGPTRDGRNKPDISAPGVKIRAAASRRCNGTTLKSGTSMAAPFVTGLVARVLEIAHKNGESLSADQIRDKVIDKCKDTRPWNSRLGMGRALPEHFSTSPTSSSVGTSARSNCVESNV